MAAADVSVPLERSLSKMMATKGDAEVDMYADYKLKQREHEFLKIQVRAGTALHGQGAGGRTGRGTGGTPTRRPSVSPVRPPRRVSPVPTSQPVGPF
eukprot:COSAG06_NODE_321_length_17580_cov_10.920313_1_plen_96_part_10